MNSKPRPNHRLYIEVLRRMTPADRLRKAWELSDFTRRLMLIGLRRLHPEFSEIQLRELALSRLDKCHNRNY